MKQNSWLLPLIAALVLLLCCVLAVCLAAGAVSVGSATWQAGKSDQVLAKDPVSSIDMNRQSPSQAERHTARLLYETSPPARSLFELAQRLDRIPEALLRSAASDPVEYQIGDRESFWLHNAEDESYFTSTATLEFSTPHAYWWIEDGYQIPATDLEHSAWNFENNTYPTNHHYFGQEWTPGIDGDPHVFIILANVPGVGGYFSGPDEYPAVITSHSNEHEMFYINLENAVPGDSYFDGVLAHEFQHMIGWAEDRDEDTWVSEGLSELASQLGGYDVGGSDYAFSQQPDTQLTTWSELEESGPHYGASYLFLSYFLERYGDEAIQRLVAEPANGIAGFEAVLAEFDPHRIGFDDLFADWVVANYLDDGTPPKARYGYADLRLTQPALTGRHRSYPVRQTGTVHQYAADYIVLDGTGPVTLVFTGSLRVPLLGNVAHSGEFQWWSNRGDEGDSTLTRAFDLTGLSEATLQAWMWYDLEVDYDYGYVQVSTDGGDTWHLLDSEHTTTVDPNANSYGPAFTGYSGGGDDPAWVQESFDLSPHAGGPVLVRFEVITDEAVNRPGLAVDDISIPELGYLDDAETDDGGWQAKGWLRVTDHIPQDFLVQIIRQGRENSVERMVLDDKMQGQMTMPDLGNRIDRVVVVVSGVAPATTEPASYRYEVRKEQRP
ncbi:hypothetical protein ACFLWA_05530 [Chloroflexota bacterium]